jgi:hypothetical protein
MTTQTQLSNLAQAVRRLQKSKAHILLWILAALLILSLLNFAIVAVPAEGESLDSSQRALKAISAHYQGMADLYAMGQKAETQRALAILSSRYQGMADLFAAGQNVEIQHALKILSSRYQGMMDLFPARWQAETMRALTIISARYQAQAEARR